MRLSRAASIVAATITALGLAPNVPEVSAATTCAFTTQGKTMTLVANCTTDQPIVIPNGFTLDGAGKTITAVDPTGGHFTGGVIQNGGASANVRNVTVTASGLVDLCDAGADRLRGILFDTASGSITNNRVLNVNQGLTSGCQEGNGIEARNFTTTSAVKVTIGGNTVSGYQKTGIVANGAVDADISDNTVDGLGPTPNIARNGVQVGFGADARVSGNVVRGNAYSGAGQAASGGILVVGGPGYGGDYTTGTQIMKNTLAGNDVGVYLSNLDGAFNAPATATNIKVVNNTIANDAITNTTGNGPAQGYQAGVSDVGNNDKIINNTISGIGYTSPSTPAVYIAAIDADPSFTNRPKVHANR